MDGAKRHAVYWSAQALGDLRAIIAFVAADAPLEARALLDRLRERAEALHSLPTRGRVVPELARAGIFGLRELVIRPYRLIYRVEESRVLVLALFDGRRDLAEILHERLTRE